MKKIVLCLFLLCLLSSSIQKTRGNYVLDDQTISVTTKDGSGTKISGSVLIEEDADGTYAKFDGGANTYIQLESLPAYDISKEGLHVVFQAKWDAFNTWSRIFDCGNGANMHNLFIANKSTTKDLAIGFNQGSGSHDMNAYVSNILTAGSYQSWDITMVNNASNETMITAKQLSPQTGTYTPAKTSGGNALDTIARGSCYIGKSNWSADAPFKGRIYYVLMETNATHKKLFEFDASKLS